MSEPSDLPTEELQYVTGRIVIEMGLTQDGRDQVWTTVTGGSDEDDKPPLITVLGMLEMARDTVYHLYSDDDEQDE